MQLAAVAATGSATRTWCYLLQPMACFQNAALLGVGRSQRAVAICATTTAIPATSIPATVPATLPATQSATVCILFECRLKVASCIKLCKCRWFPGCHLLVSREQRRHECPTDDGDDFRVDWQRRIGQLLLQLAARSAECHFRCVCPDILSGVVHHCAWLSVWRVGRPGMLVFPTLRVQVRFIVLAATAITAAVANISAIDGHIGTIAFVGATTATRQHTAVPFAFCAGPRCLTRAVARGLMVA